MTDNRIDLHQALVSQLPLPVFFHSETEFRTLNPAAERFATACEENGASAVDFVSMHRDSVFEVRVETGRILVLGLGSRLLRLAEQLAGYGRMAGGITHNLNNPLNAISGLVQLMMFRNEHNTELQKIDDQSEVLIQQIRCNADRYRRITELSNSNEIGWLELVRQEIDFYKAHMTFKHHCTYELNIPDDASVSLDYLEATWVFDRLLEACLDLVESEGSHEIYIDLSDNWPRVSILDAIPERLPHILPQLTSEQLRLFCAQHDGEPVWSLDGHRFTIGIRRKRKSE